MGIFPLKRGGDPQKGVEGFPWILLGTEKNVIQCGAAIVGANSTVL